MNAPLSNSGSEQITPAVHLEFIHNQLETGVTTAPQQIEQYHRALFLHHHGPEWERHRQEIQTRQEKLAFLESRLKDTHVRLSERAQLVPVRHQGLEDTAPTAPWNGWDLAMFVVCSLGVVALMTFGVFNISFNLLESGLITFRENPLRTYFWSALLPVGALAVKVGWDFLEDPAQRRRYLWFCLVLGMTGVLVWTAAYAAVYPTLSKGINEQIASLSVYDSSTAAPSGRGQLHFGSASWVDAITVAGQAIAEIFLSAVLGMYLTDLYARHRPVRLARDPAFAQLDRERHDLEESAARERASLGQATGHLVRLENQLAALIAYSSSVFHREAARRQDQSAKKQLALDQLSEHLRNHLQSIDAAPPGGAGMPNASLAAHNGR